MGFDVEVHAADNERLELTAHGPIGLSVRYDLATDDSGAALRASVSLRRGGGLTGRLVANAAAALLSAGALDGATGRIAARRRGRRAVRLTGAKPATAAPSRCAGAPPGVIRWSRSSAASSMSIWTQRTRP